MNKKESQETVYPPEYAHIEDKVRTTQERVQQIDEQIKHVPADSKPAPKLTPLGFLQPRHFNREEKIASLEQQKSELKGTTFSQIEHEVKNIDPKTARLVRDQSRESLYPNPFKRMDASERKSYRSMSKDVEYSQDYMDSLFSKPEERTEKENKIEEKAGSMSMNFSLGLGYTKSEVKPDRETGSMSARFSQGLSYTKATEEPNPTSNTSREREMEKD